MHAAAPTAHDLLVLRDDVRPSRMGLRRLLHPLTLILAVQAGLSVSLVWSNTAFSDEALYLWAGHLELQHWLHGTSLAALGGSANFSDYFSGAPMIYPPLAAIADTLGGLVAARFLSLIFMLITSSMVYLIGCRIFGRTEALIGVALCAVTEPLLKNGVFATYDSMGICLVAAGTYILLRAAASRYQGELIVIGAATAVLGTLVAYSYVIYLPVSILLPALVHRECRGTRSAAKFAAWTALVIVVIYVGLATILKLWPGLMYTIYERGTPSGFSRGIGSAQVNVVISDTWSWQGIVMCLAVLGGLVSLARKERQLLIWTLALSCLLVPVEQVHLESGFSLDKHLTFGICLASLAAGYGIARLLRPMAVARPLMVAYAASAFLIPAVTGYVAAWWSFHGWPDTASISAEIKRLASPGSSILFEGNTVYPLRYSYCQGRNWIECSESWLTTPIVPSGTGEAAAYAKAFNTEHIDLIVFSFGAPSADSLVQAAFPVGHSASQSALYSRITGLLASNPLLAVQVQALSNDRQYQLVAVVPEGQNASGAAQAAVIWQRIGAN